MSKTILITGSTDGIGKASAITLLMQGHRVLLHGRNQDKLDALCDELSTRFGCERVVGYCADLSVMAEVTSLAKAVTEDNAQLDVLINNAGVFKTTQTLTSDGYDMRFMVNTIAPYILTKALLAIVPKQGRIINLSSAAQSPFEASELLTPSNLSSGAVYAKSKLALTMWSMCLGAQLKVSGPCMVAVNPKSFLGSKMVQEAYGMQGSSVQLGADILVEAALGERFAGAGGLYFDNDINQFSPPHQSAMDQSLMADLMQTLTQLHQQAKPA
ncbi:SDR family NAD(P)-dependent oxidoreductase [Pseudoalteromonas umbrosa]|uniref:SDR family NAD(P)-dependent oxidoreductase n=1 Tax=Pseudoalteromonas umbrosa TaxID=3048489 RepID=UPI0024C46DCB|nr:SDR family NAD(P)-dependent oxidoreductase [Pseudoalteromonas sp. B95]MDK1290352.1 SDR family NAD(P)-dependent oxidoreductase [Pseudoalteromonas sp. B95]